MITSLYSVCSATIRSVVKHLLQNMEDDGKKDLKNKNIIVFRIKAFKYLYKQLDLAFDNVKPKDWYFVLD